MKWVCKWQMCMPSQLLILHLKDYPANKPQVYGTKLQYKICTKHKGRHGAVGYASEAMDVCHAWVRAPSKAPVFSLHIHLSKTSRTLRGITVRVNIFAQLCLRGCQIALLRYQHLTSFIIAPIVSYVISCGINFNTFAIVFKVAKVIQ